MMFRQTIFVIRRFLRCKRRFNNCCSNIENVDTFEIMEPKNIGKYLVIDHILHGHKKFKTMSNSFWPQYLISIYNNLS